MKSDIISKIRKNYKKIIIGTIVSAVIVCACIISYNVYEYVYYIRTNDAKVAADLIDVSPQISGKLMEFNINEGDIVTKDQILARQDPSGLEDSYIDKSLIRAPISGIIVKKQANVGENLSPGKNIALIVDPSSYYISANINETKASKLNIGQNVTITVDEYGGKKFIGTVDSIGKVTQFDEKTSYYSQKGKYKKILQKIPVKIKLNNSNNLDNKFILGGNAKIKIRIKK